jgi:hypothetical protein
MMQDMMTGWQIMYIYAVNYPTHSTFVAGVLFFGGWMLGRIRW